MKIKTHTHKPQLFTVIFRDITAERLGRILTGAYSVPEKGVVPFGEPEIIPTCLFVPPDAEAVAHMDAPVAKELLDKINAALAPLAPLFNALYAMKGDAVQEDAIDPLDELMASAYEAAKGGWTVLVVVADDAQLHAASARAAISPDRSKRLVFTVAGRSIAGWAFDAAVAADGVRERHAAWWASMVEPKLHGMPPQ